MLSFKAYDTIPQLSVEKLSTSVPAMIADPEASRNAVIGLQFAIGFSLSLMFTGMLQVAFPQMFVAVAITVWLPTGKKLPGAVE